MRSTLLKTTLILTLALAACTPAATPTAELPTPMVSTQAAEEAMTSNYGRRAGILLQQMTGGQMTLFIAEHKEDEITNIRKYHQSDESSE